MASVYVASNKYSAVTAWAAATAYVVGDLRRQLAAPSVGNERVFRCTTAGTSGGAEPSWNLTAGATTNDNTAVWTEVTGQSTYNAAGAWGAPHARLANALASGWAAAGDTVKVHASHDGNQSTAITLTLPGTAHTSYTRVVCVNDADTALSTGAMERVTGNAALSIAGGPSAGSFNGITFKSASTANIGIAVGTSVNAAVVRIENGLLELTAANTGVRIEFGLTDDSKVDLVNTPVKFAHAGQFLRVGSKFVWRATPSGVQGTVTTTPLIQMRNDGEVLSALIYGVDLSSLGSSSQLVQTVGRGGDVLFIDCMLGTSVVIVSGTPSTRAVTRVRLINCDSADTGYRYALHDAYVGSIVSETTIVRSGGASDGTTPVSRKMVTTANVAPDDPLVSDWIEFWNEVTGSAISLGIPIITDGVTLTDAEAWIEVEYLGTSGFPLGLFVSDRVSDPIFGTPANQTTDSSSTWTTTGLSSPVKQSLSVTFTPQEKGLIRARVMVAKATTTIYYDPRVLSESGRQYQSVAGFVNEGPSGMPLSRVFGGL